MKINLKAKKKAGDEKINIIEAVENSRKLRKNKTKKGCVLSSWDGGTILA